MNDRQVATGLGIFSLGLGAAELFAPRWLGTVTAVGQRTGLLRAYGAREIAAGLTTFARPGAGLWTRVAGDVLDLATLGYAFARTWSKRRVALAAAAVLGVTALDYLFARRLQPI